MSERCEQTNERTNEWLSSPHVDFIAIYPASIRAGFKNRTCKEFIFGKRLKLGNGK